MDPPPRARAKTLRGNAPAVPVNPYACFRTFFALRQEGQQTKVMYSYPMKQHLIMSKYPGLDRFCFPTLVNGTPIAGGGDCTFVFVLTDDGGQRQYGHCANTVNNEAYVIISKLPWVTFFRNILYSYRANGAEMGQMMIRELYAATTPAPGDIFSVRPSGMILRRPSDFPHAQFVDTNPSMLLDIFTDTQICQVVSSLLLDQNIIVMGPDFGTVSRIILAFQGLLSPMEWQHIIVSIVTPNLVEVLSSPTPFLVGIVAEQKEAVSKVMIEAVVYIEVDYVEGGNAAAKSSSSAAASRVLWGREDTREVTCTDISYLNEAKIPLPRSGTVFNSTIKKSLRALRTTSKGVFNTQADNARISEEICQIFMQYYAKHFGMMGASDFSFDNFLADLAAGIDPLSVPGKPRKSKKCPAAEQEFFTMFSQSQGSNGLKLFIQDRIADGSWATNDFCSLAMQLNEPYYRDQITAFKASSEALKAPSTMMTGAMTILFGAGGFSSTTGRGGRRGKKRSMFSRWCLRGDDGDVSSGQDDEMDDIQRIADRRPEDRESREREEYDGGMRRSESRDLISVDERSGQISRKDSRAAIVTMTSSSSGGGGGGGGSGTQQKYAVSSSTTAMGGGATASSPAAIGPPKPSPPTNTNNYNPSPPVLLKSGDVSPVRTVSPPNGQVVVQEDEPKTTTTTKTPPQGDVVVNNTEVSFQYRNGDVEDGDGGVDSGALGATPYTPSPPNTTSNRVILTPPEIGRSKLAHSRESPSVDFSYSNSDEVKDGSAQHKTSGNGLTSLPAPPPLPPKKEELKGGTPQAHDGHDDDMAVLEDEGEFTHRPVDEHKKKLLPASPVELST